MSVQSLIYGSDPTPNIVAIEYKDDMVEVFLEEHGRVRVQRLNIPYFLISDTPTTVDETATLKGDLPLKYVSYFSDRESLDRARRRLRYSGAECLNIWDDREAALMSSGMTLFKGMTPEQVSVLSFDIEATGITHDSTSKVLLISNTLRRNGTITRKLFAYDDYQDEGSMLEAWAAWVCQVDPSVVIGHNIYTYDFPYLDFCARRAGVELRLGRDGSRLRFNEFESKFRRDGSQFIYYRGVNLFGRNVVDTFFLSIKYDVSRRYESYALKSIVKHEGLEVEGRQHYDASLIRHNYKNTDEWAKIKQYAIHDADDSLALYQLMVPAFFYLTQSVPKTFQAIMTGASGSQINSMLVRSYIEAGHSLPLASEATEFEGAISIGNPGVYENVFKVDVASLYPSIMLEYKVYDKDKDPLAVLPQVLEYLTSQRLENKRLGKETGDRKYKDLDGAQKIVINSIYGFMGAPGLNFNMPGSAAEVTGKGREILTRAINWAKDDTFEIVNADTDSISITASGLSLTTENRKNILRVLNSLFPAKIKWEDDGTYDRVLVLKAKNYVLDSGSRRTIKGSALKATMKEPALKEFINAAINALISKEPEMVPSIYNKYVREIMNVKDISRWSSKKTITESVLSPDRTNERKVLTALGDTEFAQGDKRFFYFTKDGSLSLAENWNPNAPNHDTDKLLEKLYKTLQVFTTVYDTSKCLNFKLKRNRALLALLTLQTT